MQCQSCGTDIRRAMKHCPACGEETTTAFTASLANNARPTDELESGFIRANLLPKPAGSTADNPVNNIAVDSHINGANGSSSNGKSNIKTNAKTNGSAFFSAPLPPTVVVNEPPAQPESVPPTPPFSVSTPLNTANNINTREAMPPTDIIRPNIACRRCQHELKAGAKFCSVCGTSSEPSALAKALDVTQQSAKQALVLLQQGLRNAKLPTATIVLLALAGALAFMAVFQYLIPAGIDAENGSQLIYHLRSIQFLLAALISVVASLVVSRR